MADPVVAAPPAVVSAVVARSAVDPPAGSANGRADDVVPAAPVVSIPAAKLAPPGAQEEIITDLVGELNAERSDLWARLRKGFAMQDFDDPLVRKWEAWYSERPDYVARMIDRSRRYLYFIVNEIEERGMPLEIALLPMIESAYNPMAYSSAKASGMWQFIPSTGKDFGLKQTWWSDARREVVAATHGALDYLEKLHGMFGDWQLALAAYNWGEGSVSRAQAVNRRKGLRTDYPSLAMPDETRNYLPKLQAVKNIVGDPARFRLTLGDIPNFPYFKTVRVDRKMDLKRAAELAGMSVEDFQSLNPQHNRPVIAGADEHTLLLPYDRADEFIERLELHYQPLVSWRAYRLKPGESINAVADRYDLSAQTLRTVNGIGPRSRVPAGHALLVPTQQPSFEAAATLQQAVFETVPPTPTVVHRVRKGETLSSIAVRYGVRVGEIREWNRLSGDRVVINQQLRIVGDRAAVKAGGRSAVVDKLPVPSQRKPATAHAATAATASARQATGAGRSSAKSKAKAKAKAGPTRQQTATKPAAPVAKASGRRTGSDAPA